MTIREELAALDPDNKPRQRDLAINFDRIGDAQRFMQDMESALLSYQAALTIRQKLAALDPTNMVWQQDLLVSLDRMGDIHFASNDFVAALEAQEEARRIAETVVSLNPEDLPRLPERGYRGNVALRVLRPHHLFRAEEDRRHQIRDGRRPRRA